MKGDPVTTPANPADLITWLRAQLDDDERVAREAIAENDGEADWRIKQPDPDEPSWRTPRLLWLNVMDSCDPESMPPAMAEHIARHDPARVLAEVDAKRRILDAAEGAFVYAEEDRSSEVKWADESTYRWILAVLALPFADRPGYREEWRPA